jgi:uncharacterized FlgJ-related protein
MIYTYDKDRLTLKNITKHIVGTCLGIIIVLSLFISLFVAKRLNDVKYISEETKAIIINEATKANEFTPEKLRAYILELNIRFPRIVYAQARLESGNFQSNIFKINNNLYGMRLATKRPSTNKGEEAGFAYYDNWKESVEDYAMFSAAYLNNIKTEADYFEYLKQNYDNENPEYVNKLKELIAEDNVLFAKK